MSSVNPTNPNLTRPPDSAISVIISSTCSILECDRSTLFIVDNRTNELVIRQAVGTKDIRIPLTAGIAGSVYQTGEKLNISNAYDDARFNRETDKKTGYHTQSILCAPIFDSNGETVAVLQAINKLDNPDNPEEPRTVKNCKILSFTKEDELLTDHLALQLGVILRNQILREKTKLAHAQVLSLLDIVKSLHSNMGINSFMFTVTERSPKLVDADRCTLYLVDHNRQELWSLQGAVEVRTPMSKGLAGFTASTGEKLNIVDAHTDDRFNTEYDNKSGYRTKSVLVLPILGERDAKSPRKGKKVVGVLQLINKLHGERFTEEDEQLLMSFLDIAGPLLTTSQLFSGAHSKVSEFEVAKDVREPGHRLPRKISLPQLVFSDIIAEVEDEDEEDSDLDTE